MAGTATAQQMRYLQGVAVPASSIDPDRFFALTRRHDQLEKARTFAGFGTPEIFEIRKSDILAGLTLRFIGSLVVTPGTGTVATTSRWPYDWLRIKFTANGQSNVINARGLKLRVREFMAHQHLSDRGVAQTVAGASKSQGTLALADEAWGVGTMTTNIAAGTYGVDLSWRVPVAENELDLAGAIFAATSSTDLTLNVEPDTASSAFVTTGNATIALTGQWVLQSRKFTIPIGPDGEMVLPDLSVFHSILDTRETNVAQGDNETRVIGQGSGRSLLRIWAHLLNNSTTNPAPFAVNDTNFGRLAWRYSGNETPDEYPFAAMLRTRNERDYNSDIGSPWGFWCHDFATDNAFRDVINMGQTSELRLLYNAAQALTNPALEYCVETMYAADQGA